MAAEAEAEAEAVAAAVVAAAAAAVVVAGVADRVMAAAMAVDSPFQCMPRSRP